MYRLTKLGKCSLDRNSTFNQLSQHSFITADSINESAFLCVSDWNGFLNDLSTRFLPTSLMGQIQVRITLANNCVLVPCQTISGTPTIISNSAGYGGANQFTSSTAATNATQMSYYIQNIRFSIDAISVCPAYNEMLSQQLTREGELKLNYKEYYTFLASSILTNRFALASSSIDRMFGSLRPATYNQNGQVATAVPAFGTSGYVANYLSYQNFDPDTNASSGVNVVPVSNMQYQFSINNVLIPQYLAYVEDAMADMPYVWDKVGNDAKGIIASTRNNFKTGFFEVPLVLNHPSGMGLSVRSGYNSRGINSTMLLNFYNIPGATLPASYNNIVVVGTTAQLKIGVGRALAVDF